MPLDDLFNNYGLNSSTAPADTDTGGGWNWFDQTNAEGIKTQGVAGPGLGAASGLFKGWMGLKQLGVAEDELKENKRQFNMNWGAQKKSVNNQLEDRQRRRVAVTGGVAQDAGSYMNKWGIE